MNARPALTGLATAALVIAAMGCGTGGDGAQVRRAASRFLAAYARHDGAVACAS